MSGRQETVADIVAEMRGMGNYQQYSGDHAHALADRIEAAAQRVASKMHALQRDLWQGKKMGAFAFALALDGFESDLSATTAPAKGGAK